MPPKRKNTRASKRNQKEEDPQDQSQVELEERIKKKEEPVEEPDEQQDQPQEEGLPEPIPEPEPEVKEPESKKSTTKSDPKPIAQSSARQLPKPRSLPAPNSPTKRVSSVSSRIPSPIKRNPSNNISRSNDLDHKRTEQSINQSFLSKNIPKLNSIIDELKTTKSEQLFDDLKNSTELRFKTSDDLINSLTSQNQSLLTELEETKARLIELETNGNGSNSSNDNDEESYQNELILDMLEQIVGLRIHKAEDTDEALSFDCSQSGKNGVLDYKLTISKQDSSEIIYTPINEDESNLSNDLKDFLPDYFFDVLTFPIDTLQQFYHKIYRGLNK
ncbi:Zinc metalloprotease [Wickerhamomyces ciferrii]|uniref:Zinc metalloprotease n=1 Tax=Wickerhamomyces ciferrii (strain ATCC 14091 / BCRC 22168 / CBS 111 / JCM 3599 / NBRC 0793 / NRRL Y-1031 F-60-10) TaxID=1206466 RepID=K0KLZ2_WICCF|nr:Zinc metalloprotease [Wickerhamomyces ciferrii]CCH42374.1 Zinc metalloprotease [Wickerhamomyces ciferrii]